MSISVIDFECTAYKKNVIWLRNRRAQLHTERGLWQVHSGCKSVFADTWNYFDGKFAVIYLLWDKQHSTH